MRVLRPMNAEEALTLYAEHPSALPMAGGTDLMVAFNGGRLNGREVLDLSALKEWTDIEFLPDRARIGALCTHARIESHPGVLKRLPLLAQACASVGAIQIRNRGTLGGNLANASPAGDSFPALAVYEAQVVAVSAQGGRTIPIRELFAGVKKTTLQPGELIAGVEVPLFKREPQRAVFRKVGSRRAQTISKAVAAGLLWVRAGKVEELRFALGSVAPTVRRAAKIEEFLRGRALSESVVEQSCAMLEEEISPIDDVRSTRAYRLGVCRGILRALLSSGQKG